MSVNKLNWKSKIKLALPFNCIISVRVGSVCVPLWKSWNDTGMREKNIPQLICLSSDFEQQRSKRFMHKGSQIKPVQPASNC